MGGIVVVVPLESSSVKMPWGSGLLAACLTLATFGPASGLAAADAGSPWTPGSNAVGDDTFSGFIDEPLSGLTITRNSTVQVRGWLVDRTAVGWTGIDDVQIYRGLPDQGGPLLARATVGQRRDDVAETLGNGYWAGAGFTASFTDSGLAVGSNLLTVYAHTPDRGSWYKQVEVRVQPLPAIAYADDPLFEVREVVPSVSVDQRVSNLTLRGFAIDRNLPQDLILGASGSGVSRVQVYLDGPRGSGTLLGNADLGRKSPELLGFGKRFANSGWEFTVHPRDFSVDKHAFFVYAASAYWPNSTLVIVPFEVL